MRVRNEDIQEAIFRPLGEQKQLEPFVGDGEIYFTLKGLEEDEIDGIPVVYNKNSKNIFAKKITERGSTTFWIRIAKDGKFYNHLGLDGEKIVREKFYEKETKNKFIKTNKQAFNLYCKFLSTKNVRYLKASEKEVI